MRSILDQVKLRRFVKRIRRSGVRYASIAALFSSTGCAITNPEGFEFGAKLGMYAVNERKESQSTIANPCRGLRAWVAGCPTQSRGEVDRAS